MIVSINQPAYLPWLGYFDRISKADLHVVLDHVQFEKNGFTNRNKIRTKEGWIWLSVPVETSGKFKNNPINEVRIVNHNNWQKKHLESFRLYYRKSKYFDIYFPFLEEVFNEKFSMLNDLIKKINQFVLMELEITTKIKYSSEFCFKEVKSDLVLEICKYFNAKMYLSGTMGKNYLESTSFSNNNIEIKYHEYNHPIYDQIYEGFEYSMNIFDLLFNHGKESKLILEEGFNFD